MVVKNKQTGFSLMAVLLAAVAITSALAVVLAGGTSIASMSSNNNAAHLVASQANLIRSRILQCATEFPTGDNATAFRKPYPAGESGLAVSSLTCPGSTLNLWNTGDGVSIPSTVSGFGLWQYANDATSMRILISTTSSDRTDILPVIANFLGAQASVAGGTLTWTIAQ